MAEVYIICGFPGVGKSTLYNAGKACDYVQITYSASSKYAKYDFPQNYVSDIHRMYVEAKQSAYKTVVILCSTHEDVRRALKERGIPYVLVFPERDIKQEYLERYREHGASPELVRLISDNWDNWLGQLEKEERTQKVTLFSGQYLSDIAPMLGIRLHSS